MVEDLRILNGADPIPPTENSPYVRRVIESSVGSVRNFQALSHSIQAGIITGMTEILAPVEAKNRGRWYADGFKIGEWKLDTLATLRGDVVYDDEEEGVRETEEAILLRQLAEGISRESGVSLPKLLTPIREIFKRTIITIESGLASYGETQTHKAKRRRTGELKSGKARSSGGISHTGSSTQLRPRPHETARFIS